MVMTEALIFHECTHIKVATECTTTSDKNVIRIYYVFIFVTFVLYILIRIYKRHQRGLFKQFHHHAAKDVDEG